MFLSNLPSPILLVSDCTQPPPQDIATRWLDPGLIRYAYGHPNQTNAILWSRLILLSLLIQGYGIEESKAAVRDDYSNWIRIAGRPFKYARVAVEKGKLTLAVSALPIYLSFKSFDASYGIKDLVRLRFSVIFNDWIDRQENPELAFYHLWALRECLIQRNDPTVRILIGDDDQLTVRGASVMLRETFQFWTSSEWLCAVQGPALSTLLTAVRTPEHTVELLRDV